MADILKSVLGNIIKRFRDLGDGTFAEQVTLTPYPGGATPVHAAATGAASAIAPALAAAAGKTTHITGFELTGGGATAASVIAVTVTGLLGGTETFNVPVPAGATSGIAPLLVRFDPPIPASAANQAITVNVPSFGAGNTASACAVHGFQL